MVSPVNVAAMPQTHHGDQQNVVLDGVDDAVVADADPQVSGAILHRASARGTRVDGKCEDGPTDAGSDFGMDFAQVPFSSRQNLDRISHVVQPRSFIT